ncbi:MAG: winged helix-turn-helix transcriptional regulator [Caldilineaceae bacterium]|nr:winged helix-turn-helix transcriptional regulator [Caldilineaceae bacterium]
MTDALVETVTICTAEHTDEELARFAQEHLLDEETAGYMAELFKSLADPTRLRIVGLLANAEVCVGDLHQIMGMTQPAISHHLRVLRNLRLVKARRDGRHVYYTLDDDHVELLFRQGLSHVLHS